MYTDHRAILRPICVQVLITFAVWLWMTVGRVTAIRSSGVDPESLRDDARADVVFAKSALVADNFENLFELPVLFYVAGVILFMTGLQDRLSLALAWIFVAARTVHSVIHCLPNHKISHRFAAYLVGAGALWAIWLKLAVDLTY